MANHKGAKVSRLRVGSCTGMWFAGWRPRCLGCMIFKFSMIVFGNYFPPSCQLRPFLWCLIQFFRLLKNTVNQILATRVSEMPIKGRRRKTICSDHSFLQKPSSIIAYTVTFTNVYFQIFVPDLFGWRLDLIGRVCFQHRGASIDNHEVASEDQGSKLGPI